MRIQRTQLELEARIGRAAGMAEIARAAGVPLDAVVGALESPHTEPLEDGDGVPADPIAALDDRLALAAALRSLPLRERRILLLAFYGERSQRRIAGDLGLSQIHVSRLLRSALARLRAALDEGGAPVAGSTREA